MKTQDGPSAAGGDAAQPPGSGFLLVFKICVATALLGWRIWAYPLDAVWRDWVAILSLYWIGFPFVAPRFRGQVTVGAMAYLFGVFLHGEFRHVLAVFGGSP